MKQRSRERPLREDEDSQTMREAIAWIESQDLPVYRPNIGCYYVEGVKFWPDAGTVQIDDRKREKERGLAGFERVLRREGILTTRPKRKYLPMQVDDSQP